MLPALLLPTHTPPPLTSQPWREEFGGAEGDRKMYQQFQVSLSVGEDLSSLRLLLFVFSGKISDGSPAIKMDLPVTYLQNTKKMVRGGREKVDLDKHRMNNEFWGLWIIELTDQWTGLCCRWLLRALGVQIPVRVMSTYFSFAVLASWFPEHSHEAWAGQNFNSLLTVSGNFESTLFFFFCPSSLDAFHLGSRNRKWWSLHLGEKNEHGLIFF